MHIEIDDSISDPHEFFRQGYSETSSQCFLSRCIWWGRRIEWQILPVSLKFMQLPFRGKSHTAAEFRWGNLSLTTLVWDDEKQTVLDMELPAETEPGGIPISKYSARLLSGHFKRIFQAEKETFDNLELKIGKV